MNRRLNNTLSHHCIYNLFETCNVSTNNEVVRHIITFCSIADLSIDQIEKIYTGEVETWEDALAYVDPEADKAEGDKAADKASK